MNDVDFLGIMNIDSLACSFQARMISFKFIVCQAKRFSEMKLIICETKNWNECARARKLGIGYINCLEECNKKWLEIQKSNNEMARFDRMVSCEAQLSVKSLENQTTPHSSVQLWDRLSPLLSLSLRVK